MSKESELHAAECNAQWDGQARTNERYERNFEGIFKRLNSLEVKLAGWGFLGGAFGALLGKLF